MDGDKYYHLLLGELYTGVDRERADAHFRRAEGLTNTPSEKRVIALKLSRLADVTYSATGAAERASNAAERVTGIADGVTDGADRTRNRGANSAEGLISPPVVSAKPRQ